MQRLGTKNVCFVAPERMEIGITLMAKLQRELMELHQQSIHNTDQTYDWAIGILIKLAQAPQEDIGLGKP